MLYLPLVSFKVYILKDIEYFKKILGAEYSAEIITYKYYPLEAALTILKDPLFKLPSTEGILNIIGLSVEFLNPTPIREKCLKTCHDEPKGLSIAEAIQVLNEQAEKAVESYQQKERSKNVELLKSMAHAAQVSPTLYSETK